MAETLLSFKAGRAFRREGSNVVEPSPTKGAIILVRGEDELLHLLWKDRSSGEVKEDLILFPFDASFAKVPQFPSGRVYVLKFSSSNQRHFFWMQDASDNLDADRADKLNRLLQDSDGGIERSADLATGRDGGVAATGVTAQGPTDSNFQPTAEQLATLQSVLTQIAGRTAVVEQSEISLNEILTRANLMPLFINHPELVPTLFPHLPPDLPVPPSTQALERIIHSTQFRSAVANFDQALRTGMLGGLVRALGLPDEAGTGILPFLRAVQEQADRESAGAGNNTMDTD